MGIQKGRGNPGPGFCNIFAAATSVDELVKFTDGNTRSYLPSHFSLYYLLELCTHIMLQIRSFYLCLVSENIHS